jgi:hypothetical protein
VGQRREAITHQQRHLGALLETCRRARVEVDDQPVGVADAAARPDLPLRDMQLQGGEVRDPGEPGAVLDDRVGDLLAVLEEPGESSVTVRTHSGVPRGTFFSKNTVVPVTPSGHRLRVIGRPASCGRMTSATDK